MKIWENFESEEIYSNQIIQLKSLFNKYNNFCQNLKKEIDLISKLMMTGLNFHDNMAMNQMVNNNMMMNQDNNNTRNQNLNNLLMRIN